MNCERNKFREGFRIVDSIFALLNYSEVTESAFWVTKVTGTKCAGQSGICTMHNLHSLLYSQHILYSLKHPQLSMH